MAQGFRSMTRTATASTIFSLCFLAASAQTRHGTAVIAIRHGNSLVIAADSLEAVSPNATRRQTTTSACKIFTAGHTVFSLAGIAGIGADSFSNIFVRDPAFTRVYDQAAFQKSADRWAASALEALNTRFWSFPQDYWQLHAADRSTTAIFAGITSAGKLILIQERIHDDPAHIKKFPHLAADSRIIAIDETLVMGGGAVDTYTELRTATSPRAIASTSLLTALDHPPTLPIALQTAHTFIATTETWHPEESNGDIAELAFSPLGTIWTSHPSTCR
jgi:hypothetical protein